MAPRLAPNFGAVQHIVAHHDGLEGRIDGAFDYLPLRRELPPKVAIAR